MIESLAHEACARGYRLVSHRRTPRKKCQLYSLGVGIIEGADLRMMDGGWRVHDSLREMTVFVGKIDVDGKPASNWRKKT